jgi:hypothetical protein
MKNFDISVNHTHCWSMLAIVINDKQCWNDHPIHMILSMVLIMSGFSENLSLTKKNETTTDTGEAYYFYWGNVVLAHHFFFSIWLNKFNALFTSTNQFLLDLGLGLVVFGADYFIGISHFLQNSRQYIYIFIVDIIVIFIIYRSVKQTKTFRIEYIFCSFIIFDWRVKVLAQINFVCTSVSDFYNIIWIYPIKMHSILNCILND